jgi:phosphohistidine swiveling domain-containing protein
MPQRPPNASSKPMDRRQSPPVRRDSLPKPNRSGYVLWLGDSGSNDRPLVGGKAAALAELLRLGVVVPPAFVVTTHAYADCVSPDVPPHTPNVQFEWPDQLTAEIAAALILLSERAPHGRRLIVRSSAPFEDSAEFSAAGQLESYVSPFDLKRVLDAIRRCWSALSRPEWLPYAHQAGAQGQADMAVIVQELIETDVAGVLFTQGMGPADTSEVVVIEAGWGLSHGVTSGAIVPDRYRLDRHTGQVLEITLSPGVPLRTVLTAEDETQTVEAPELVGRRTLNEQQLSALVAVARQIEDYYGAAQDIEWGFRDRNLYIFQARPVTVSPRSPREDVYTTDVQDQEAIWVSGFFEERFPNAVSPLSWTYLFPVIELTALREPLHYLGVQHLEDLPFLRLLNGHVYTNLAVFQMLYKFYPRFLLPDDARRFFPGGDVSLRRAADQPHFFRLVWSVLRMSLTEPNWHPLNYRVWRRFVRQHDLEIARVQRDLEAQPDAAALLRLLDRLHDLTLRLLRIHRWSLNYAEVFSTVLRKLIARWTSLSPEVVQTYLVTAEDNPTLLNDHWLRSMAAQASALGLTAEDVMHESVHHPDLTAQMDVFLSRFGHRSFCLDLLCPRYADQPGEVWAIVADLMRQADASQKEDPAGRRTAERHRIRQDLDQQLHRSLLDRIFPVRAWLVGLVLFFAQRYGVLREAQRYEWQKDLYLMRRVFVLAETNLITAGILRQSGDVFFLARSELHTLLSGGELSSSPAALVTARRRAFNRVRYAPYPRFVKGNESCAPVGNPEPGKQLQGVGASAGQATGRARVVMHPESLADLLHQLSDEDILVTQATDPGWTLVFGRVRALVMSLGGQLSHGAIVAREYGLPAVVGLGDAVSRIQDGDRLLVDGTHGTVTILETPSGEHPGMDPGVSPQPPSPA